MKKNFLTIMFTAAFAIAALFTVSCGDTQSDDATDDTQTEMTDEDVVSEEPTVEDANVDDADSHEGHNHDEIAEASYQCPMKCEADKTYTEEGKCPKCEMPLEKLAAN